MPPLVRHIDDLIDGESRGCDPQGVGRDTVIVVRSEGQVFAYLDDCPHISGSPLAWRKNAYLSADKRHIVCHAHGAKFNIKTGLCTQGPCLGQSLTQVKTTQWGNGEIHLA